MKILIATPDEGKLLDLVVSSIARQHCPVGVDRLDHVVLRDHTPGEYTKQEKVACQYNAARDLALSAGYDALLTWENDIVTHKKDTISMLWGVDADVVHATYCFRKPGAPWNLALLDGMKAYHLSSFPEKIEGQIIEVDGYGLGCTLIHRQVLENLRFRSTGLLHEDGGESHCDWYFAQDLQNMTIGMASSRPVVRGHLDAIVGHVHHWPIPHILYPVQHSAAMDPRFPYVAMPFSWSQDPSLIPERQRQRQYEQLRLMHTETSEYLSLIHQEASAIPNGGILLEIGVNYGVSTTALLAGKPPSSRLYSVDVDECERARKRLGEADVWDWEFIQSDSLDTDTIEMIRKSGSIDLLLVDGLHTYDQVYGELETYCPLLSKDGVVLVHDVLLHAPVGNAVADFCSQQRKGERSWRFTVEDGYCGMAVLRPDERSH